MSNVSQVLQAIEEGDANAAAQLLPLVYDDLRHLAAVWMAREAPGQTLNGTALVHEAYLRLVADTGETSRSSSFNSRKHFFAAAAEAMRRILVENARRKRSVKHGGERERVPLPDLEASAPDEAILELDEALSFLAVDDSLAAQVVNLHHFAGLSHEHVAEMLEITVYQARQKWTYARAWLKTALRKT